MSKMAGEIECCDHGTPVETQCAKCVAEQDARTAEREEREARGAGTIPYPVSCKHNWPTYNKASCPDCLNEETEHMKEKCEHLPDGSVCICGKHNDPAMSPLKMKPIDPAHAADLLTPERIAAAFSNGGVLEPPTRPEFWSGHKISRVFGPDHLGKGPAAAQDGDCPAVGISEPQAVEKPATSGGLRFNAGKNQIELLPPEWTWSLAVVMTWGSVKYAPRNWELGMKWSYPVGCAFRHLFKFICGERYDAETGCHHLAMVAWNVLVLMSYDIRKIGENDLVGKMEWLELVATAPGPELQAKIDALMAKSK